jgi:predicted dehydrogenase
MGGARRGAVVVGTGFGRRVHVPALRAAGFEVVALVGRDPERTARRAARGGIEHSFASIDDALASRDVQFDIVTIATPPATHERIAVAALESGRHVVCEKPFARDVREARRMVDAASAAGTIALVGHEFRWATGRVAVARAIAAGAIGEPRVASLVQFVPLVAEPEARTPDWWFDADAGGGWLGASGSHVVDQIRVWLGEFESVSATLGVTSNRPASYAGAEDSFTVRFRLRNGVEGVMQQTAGAWGPLAGLTRVAGTTGTVWIDGDTAWVADAEGSRPLPVDADLLMPVETEVSDDPRHRFTRLELGPYTQLLRALQAAIDGAPLDGLSVVPVPTFADGLACVEVLDAIRASSVAGGTRIEVARS